MEQPTDCNSSEDEDEDDDPVVTADDRQGIISIFHKDIHKKPPIDVCLFNEDRGIDKFDPRHKEKLNPGGLRGDASNSKENEFFGLYVALGFAFCIFLTCFRCIKNYNNDFEHECFDDALGDLVANVYEITPVDGGIQRFMIPGCGILRFYPHQVWGI